MESSRRDDAERLQIPKAPRIDSGGRLLIPAHMRRELKIEPGDPVSVSIKDGALRVRSLDAAIKSVQRELRELFPPGYTSQDFIREKRDEQRDTEARKQRDTKA